ncbi:tannase/feruloyl esterase family alpha/beta hydrolase [Asticcacaulis solisilvae]|uniref:tannase/feruloyl esterase family alpha/beta hydrolase n=1 Tax=Asticcacaulis solisilvae TaxID=1217274 RepID=UPI003FD703A9
MKRSTAAGYAASGALLCLFSASLAHAATPGQTACEALAHAAIAFPGPSTRIASADYHPATDALPAHCEIVGVAQERDGLNGQHYAIRFHLRLPDAWAARFVFEGGGGLDGDVGNATGPVNAAGLSAVAQGFAVVSGDSGHSNATNSDPAHNGPAAFGFDPVARENYGHAALKITADAAKTIIRTYYGKGPTRSYYVGCSKGGQEGMAFAQRYPDTFDGILVTAPGFSLPRAAIAEAWDTQSFAALARTDTGQAPFTGLSKVFSAADFALTRTAILDACDDLDGLKDGIAADAARCTDARVLPQLTAKTCAGDKTDTCLSATQVTALTRVVHGPRDSKGKVLYSDWAWPSGIAAPDWAMWKTGTPDGRVPALNVFLGGPALASVFMTPPVVLGGDPQSLLDYQLAFDFDRDAPRIYTTAAPFTHSSWEDISARSSDLAALHAHGAKMIVVHGESDPVFSLKDTEAWYDDVTKRFTDASTFVRLFPVPGMCHCGGGLATSQYDAFSALVAWVEHDSAPDTILATAPANTPWPGRTRPLCPYPLVARYNGSGDIERAESFTCKT